MSKKGIKHLVAILVIFYVVGIIGLSLDLTRELFVQLIPFTILMSNGLLVIFQKPKKVKHLLVFSVILIAGFLVEVIGVSTGIIFGGYSYTNVLGFQLFNTPIILGFNWAMLVYMAYVIVDKLKINEWQKVVLSAVILVIYDLVLEPFAIFYGLWNWDAINPPLQNYIAWFVISILFMLLVRSSKIKITNPVAIPLFLIQFLFFSVLYSINSI
jgi:putative membrane protein